MNIGKRRLFYLEKSIFPLIIRKQFIIQQREDGQYGHIEKTSIVPSHTSPSGDIRVKSYIVIMYADSTRRTEHNNKILYRQKLYRSPGRRSSNSLLLGVV